MGHIHSHDMELFTTNAFKVQRSTFKFNPELNLKLCLCSEPSSIVAKFNVHASCLKKITRTGRELGFKNIPGTYVSK